MEGRLRRQKLRIRVDSECRHCSRPLSLEVDDELRWTVLSDGAEPLLFEPDIAWSTFRGENIIHDY